MKSTISYLKILAGATCVLVAACDSVKDVENKPAANVQPETVVLGGQINGLSSLRSITLQNNDDIINTRSVINAVPTLPNVGVRPVPFSFGAVSVGSAYNITVKQQPELKNCVVENGQGVLTKGVTPNIIVNCNYPSVTTGPGSRHDLTVQLPSDPEFFGDLPLAKVRVTNEEEIREVTVTPGQTTSVTFPGVLIDATGTNNPAIWTVNASTFTDDREFKCAVSKPTNIGTGPGASTPNPTGDINAPVVGLGPNGTAAANGAAVTQSACQFFVRGKVGYSLPAGASTIPAIDGLRLQLRDTQDNVLETLNVPTCTPTSAAVTTVTGSNAVPVVGTNQTVPVPTDGCSFAFSTTIRSSTSSGLYEVAVSQQPTGQACIVVNGGAISVFTLGTVAPVGPTNAHVFCRALPSAPNRELNGVFRLQSSTWTPNITSPVPVTSTWNSFDTTVQNTASSNMLGFFRNGTFLYGAHANGAQVEHGFYDYDPATQKLRFTLIVDTSNSTTFPSNFSPVLAPGNTPTSVPNIGNTRTTTPGISAAPNPIRQNGTSHYSMSSVVFGTASSGGLGDVRTISGTFGADGAPFPTTATTANSRLDWVLQEPGQVDGEMTGAWLQEDGRRLWVWDFRTYYGTAVGMLGGSPSMNDACFTMENLHWSKGIYTRRGSGTGCYPFARPAVGQAYTLGTGESVDLTVFGPSSAAIIPQLPDYTGRIPGGQFAPGTFSPSPVYFQVAPAATFFTVADPLYFPTVPTNCTTEILGLRSTSNGSPINPPVYFCRTRFNQ